MEEELRKSKMLKLSYHLKDISNNLSNIDSLFDELFGFMKENVIIDEKIVEEENLKLLKKELIGIKNEIDTKVLVEINHSY